MDQFSPDMTDTLGALMVYQYELDAVVVKLEGVQRTNTVLAVLLVVLVLASACLTLWLVKRNRIKMRKGELANKLLQQQAAAMPLFTDKVNKLSAKGIKLSGRLYLIYHCSGIFLSIFHVPVSSLPLFPKPAPAVNLVCASLSHSFAESDGVQSALGSGRANMNEPNRSSFSKLPESISS